MSKALATKNVAAVLLGVALVVTFAFAFATPAKADTLTDLQAQVQALLAQISSLQGGTTTGGTMSGAGCHTFTQNLKKGSTGGEVMWVQQFLNGHGFQISASGAGSPGNETSYLGSATAAAIKKFQEANKADILTPVGLTTGTGNWFAATRAKANAMCAGGGTTGGGTTGGTTGGTGVGGTLSISAGTQPPNSLAPSGASRVPFTTFMLTNTSGAAVTVTGVTVQRTGLANDSMFSGVVLVDSNGGQIGVSRTFDSNHMTTVGENMTLNPGQSVTLTVAGNMTTSNASTFNGQVASIAVTGVNVSSGTVGGSLPITGAMQTFNSTLSLGTVTTGVSSFDPNNASTKNIGNTAVKFSAVRFTAGSQEDIKLYSIRWRTNGSVSPSDLGNVQTFVNGTSYPTVVSTDGRYYTSTFPGGILMQKGNSADVYVQGDLVGANASGRTVEFDLDKVADVYFVGQTYGYGVTPSLNGSCTVLLTGAHQTCLSAASGGSAPLQPWLQGSVVTVQGGTVTTIQNATAVASQNIATNVPNQVLGGFQTNFAGEPVTVQGITFSIATSSTAGSGLTSVSIVDENGAVVAGPVDQTPTAATLVFTNSITFPTGLHTYTLKGRVASNVNNGATYQLSTTPSSSSSWVSPQGQLTGNTVTISVGAFSMNTMTVRGATLSIAASANPAAQSVVAGGQNVVLANLQFDASQSGEDIRVNRVDVAVSATSTVLDSSLSNCQIWDGATSLTTGTNVNNSITSAVTDGALESFTLDNSLVITKGTVKTLGLSCSISSSASPANAIKFGVDGDGTTLYTNGATGVQSGSALTPTVSNSSFSGLMTISSGATVALSVDSSSPSYQVAAAGTTGITVGVIKLRATNEAFNLTKIGLSAANGVYGTLSTGASGAATAAGDLLTVYLYSGATQIGTVTFLGGNTVATSTLNAPLAIARDVDTLITVKADLANIGVSSSGGIGNIVRVDPLNFEGTGAASGSTVRGGATGSGTSGVRMFKSFPTFALETLPSTGVSDQRLLRFSVTPATVNGSVMPIGIAQFSFRVATTTGSATNIQLFGYTDSSYSQSISGQGSGGQIGSTQWTAPASTGGTIAITPTTNPVQVSSKTYFELRGTVSAPTNTTITTTLAGDSAISLNQTSSLSYEADRSSLLTATSSLVWSGNSTSTSATTDLDWSNGFTIPGLPSSGLIQTRSN